MSSANAGIVALFPGQGAQQVGMGKELLENFAQARAVFEEASDGARINVRKLCLDGPECELVLTENTQPCLLAVSVAAFRCASSEFGFTPAAAAGHSLGEYSALVAAGSLPLGTASAWVRERGQAMQKAVPAGHGAMAAVLGLGNEAIEKLCSQATALAIRERAEGEHSELKIPAVVEPANFNSPGQIVIAGSADAVAAAVSLVKAASGTDGDFSGGKAIPLAVSAPFHSRLMEPACAHMAAIFAQAPVPSTPAFPYVPNRTARLTREPAVIHELLVEQIDHPVLWSSSMSGLLEAGYLIYAEFGPGKVLTGLLKRIAQPLGKSPKSLNIGDLAGLKALESFR